MSQEAAQGEGMEIATVYEFRGDKIRRIRVFADVQEALATVGLEKQRLIDPSQGRT